MFITDKHLTNRNFKMKIFPDLVSPTVISYGLETFKGE